MHNGLSLIQSVPLIILCFFSMQSGCASIPLIDGMVIPLCILSLYLRQAVHSLSRRKRLEDSQRFAFRPSFKTDSISSLLIVLPRHIPFEKIV